MLSELSFPKSFPSPQESFRNIPYFLSQQLLKFSGLLSFLIVYKQSGKLKWNRVREDIGEK